MPLPAASDARDRIVARMRIGRAANQQSYRKEPFLFIYRPTSELGLPTCWRLDNPHVHGHKMRLAATSEHQFSTHLIRVHFGVFNWSVVDCKRWPDKHAD